MQISDYLKIMPYRALKALELLLGLLFLKIYVATRKLSYIDMININSRLLLSLFIYNRLKTELPGALWQTAILNEDVDLARDLLTWGLDVNATFVYEKPYGDPAHETHTPFSFARHTRHENVQMLTFLRNAGAKNSKGNVLGSATMLTFLGARSRGRKNGEKQASAATKFLNKDGNNDLAKKIFHNL